MKKISFIIPCFNMEKYIHQCIDSILNLELKNFEIIIIDDQSKDKSVEVINSFKNSHIKLLFSQGRGPGTARNIGLEKSTGDYIVFVDADDVVLKEGFIKLIKPMTQHDLSIGLIESFNSKKKWILESNAKIIKREELNLELSSNPSLSALVSPCAKIFKSNLIKKYDLKFLDDCFWGEDAYFVSMYMQHCGHIYVNPNPVYGYRQRESTDASSLTTKIRVELFSDLNRVSEKLDNYNSRSPYFYSLKHIRDVHFLKSLNYHYRRFIVSDTVSEDEKAKALFWIQSFISRVDRSAIEIFSEENKLIFFLLMNGYFDISEKIVRKSPFAIDDLRIAMRGFMNIFLLKAAIDYINVKSAKSVVKKPYKKASPFWWSKVFAAMGLAKILKKNKNIYLIGERGGNSVQDTGYLFFKKIIDEKSPDGFYFVTKNENYQKVERKYRKHLIKYGSFRHFVLFFSANYLIYNDSLRDVFYHFKRLSYHRIDGSIKAKKVFLQHGIIGMTNIQKYYHFDSMSERGEVPDIFCVSSEFEKKIIVNNFGHRNENVFVTGLSRYDYLEKSNSDNSIVFMPTWRLNMRWDKNSDFSKSKYFKNIDGWLKSVKLNSYLEKYKLNLDVIVHHAFSEKIKNFNIKYSDRIKILTMNDVSVQEKIKKSLMLITDYSSVSFDFAYLKKPVIYWMFDKDAFLDERGGTPINYKKDIPGEIVFNIDELNNSMKFYIDNNYKCKDEFIKVSDKYFKFRDNNNSIRIFNYINNI